MISSILERFAHELSAESRQEVEAVVKGVLTAASSIMPSVQFKDREGRPTRVNLFYAVIASAGSNKSRIGHLDRLIQPIHKHVKDEQDLLRSQLPKNQSKPPRKNVLISGNITRARVIEHLCANGETPLIVVDSEMDSITTSMKTDHGGFRAELRKAYHGEFISSSKKTDDEILEVSSPHMSMIITGTLDQAVKYLHPLADGFASRHLYHIDLSKSEYKPYSVDASATPKLAMDLWASRFYEIWKFYKDREVLVSFSQEQYDVLNTFGASENESITAAAAELNSKDFLYRHLLMMLKVAATLSALRAFLEGITSPVIHCNDEDFTYAYLLVTRSYEQFQDLYPSLPQEKYHGIQLNETDKLLLESLSDSFTTEDAYENGLKFGRAQRSVRDCLHRLKLLGAIERKKVGVYKKVS